MKKRPQQEKEKYGANWRQVDRGYALIMYSYGKGIKEKLEVGFIDNVAVFKNTIKRYLRYCIIREGFKR